MITDKVRFSSLEKCIYGNFVLYFGLLDNTAIYKWYLIKSDTNEIFSTVPSKVKNTDTIRVVGMPGMNAKHFYMRKIKNDRVEHKSTMTVIKVRD